MVPTPQKRFNAPLIWGIVAWLIVGPYLCFWLVGVIGLRIPLTHVDSIDMFGQTIVPGGLAGIAMYFLPLPLWQRVLAFVVYSPIAGVGTFLVVVSLACYFTHNCL